MPRFGLIAALASACTGCDIGLAPVQFDCGPLEAPAPGGGCQRVGVPEASCTVTPDGRGGCEMSMDECQRFSTPLSTCAPACRAPDPRSPRFPLPCPEFVPPFGSVYVDGAYTGGDGDGTIEKPFSRIQDALPLAESFAAGPDAGAMVLLAEGVYAESLLVRDNVYLCGMCADSTIIQGTNPTLPTVHLALGYGGDSGGILPILQYLTVDAPGDGIFVDGWPDGEVPDAPQWALLDDLRIRANGYAVQADNAGLRVLRSVLERSEGAALDATGSTVEVVDTAIQPTRMRDGMGRGIAVHGGAGRITISGSLVDAQPEVGVLVEDADLTVEDTWIRGPPPGEGTEGGPGIVVGNEVASDSSARLTLRSSVVERSRDVGVEIVNASATIDSTVIRATSGDDVGCHGQGLRVLSNGTEASTTTVRQSLIEQSRTAGVQAHGATLVMDRVLVRDTQPEECSDQFGDGIVVVAGGRGAVDGSRVEASAGAAFASFGARAAVSATALGCSTASLAAEPFESPSAPAVTADATSVCGCATEWAPCKAASFGLEPRISVGAACNLLVNDGPKFEVVTVPEMLPYSQGGSIVDGVYVLFENVFFSGDSGLIGSGTQNGKLRIADGMLEYVYRVNADEERATGTLAVDGTEFIVSHDCPGLPPVPGSYTASPTTLVLVFPHTEDVSIGNVWTFTKQP